MCFHALTNLFTKNSFRVSQAFFFSSNLVLLHRTTLILNFFHKFFYPISIKLPTAIYYNDCYYLFSEQHSSTSQTSSIR